MKSHPLRTGLILTLGLSACFGDDDQPGSHEIASTTRLIQYSACSDLEADMKDVLTREVEAYIDQVGEGGGWGRGGAEGDSAPEASGNDSSTGGREEGKDYSGTNNQEEGVDEADLVKTDGYHIYALNGNRLHVFGVPEFGQLVPESVLEIEGYPTQMLLDSDAGKAVVFSMIYPEALPEGHPLRALAGEQDSVYGWWWRNWAMTKITVVDISDRTAPELVREVYFEGQYQTARKVDASVRVAAYTWLNQPVLWHWYDYYAQSGNNKDLAKARAREEIAQLDIDDFIPRMHERTPDGNITTQALTNDSCRSFYRPTDSHAHGVSSILSLDLLGSTLSFDADHIVSNYATFYASTDTLVLAELSHDWWWYWWYDQDPEHLNIHAFDISTPGQTSYIGSGRVEGWLFDSFSIDAEGDTIRVATTTSFWNRWWTGEPPPEPESNLFVLRKNAGELETIGHLGKIAVGERIMSARLLADKAFLVTFEQVDPLWTIDLSDPTDPELVGELEVPGFSTYLHPIAGDNLLSIGVGGDENGANWKTTVSLFDVGNFAEPSLTDSLPLTLDEGWGWSEALWEHKAFTYWAPEKLLAVPQSTYNTVTDSRGVTEYRYLSRLELVRVDENTGLSLRGAIDHSDYYNSDPDYYWSSGDIRRSIFMGDFIYAVSDKAISVHRLDTLGLVADERLPGYRPDDYYWWW